MSTKTVTCRCGYPLPVEGNGSHSCAYYYEQHVTAMQDQIKNLQRVAIKASFYFYLPHSDDAYDEVLEALDAAGYKRPDEAGYLKEEG